MEPLLTGLLSNAILVLPLALAAWVCSGYLHRPAFSHALWVLVLVKLVTPPVISVAVVVDAAKWPNLAASLPAAQSVPANRAPWPGVSIYTHEAIERMATMQRQAGPREIVERPTEMHPTPLTGFFSSRNEWLNWLSYWNSPEGLRLFWSYVPKAILTLVWLLGALVAATVLQYRVALLRRVLQDAGPADPFATQRAAMLCGRSRRRTPPVILVDVVISPTLVGLGRTTRILFPRVLWQTLPAQQRDTLLLHELAHFRRGDHWLRALEAVTSILFWWHPVVWLAKACIRWDEELCCDAAAVSGPPIMSRTYAEALLATIDFISEGDSRSLPIWGTGVRPLRAMQCRLQQIMKRRIRSRMSFSGRGIVLTVAVMALPVELWLMGSSQQVPPAAGPAAVATDPNLTQLSHF